MVTCKLVSPTGLDVQIEHCVYSFFVYKCTYVTVTMHRGVGGGGGGDIRQIILAREAGIRQRMDTQGAWNSTYAILLHNVRHTGGARGRGIRQA